MIQKYLNRKPCIWLLGALWLLCLDNSAVQGQVWRSSDDRALHFNNERYFYVESENHLEPTTQLTLEAWVKPDIRNNGNWRTIASCLQDRGEVKGGGYGLFLEERSGKFWVRFMLFTKGKSDGPNALTTRAIIDPNEWTHIMATYSATTGRMIIYINGEEEGASNASGNIAYDYQWEDTDYANEMCSFNSTDLHIGRRDDRIERGSSCDTKLGNVLDYYYGGLYHLRVWSMAKSQDYAEYISKKNSIVGIEEGLELFISAKSFSTIEDVSPNTHEPRHPSDKKPLLSNPSGLSFESSDYLCTEQIQGFDNPKAPEMTVENIGCQQIRVSWDENKVDEAWDRVSNGWYKDWILIRADVGNGNSNSCVTDVFDDEFQLTGNYIKKLTKKYEIDAAEQGYWIIPWNTTSVDISTATKPGKNDHRFILMIRYWRTRALSAASTMVGSTYQPPVPRIETVETIKRGDKFYNEVSWTEDLEWKNAGASTSIIPNHQYVLEQVNTNPVRAWETSEKKYSVEVNPDQAPGTTSEYRVYSKYDQCANYPTELQSIQTQEFTSPNIITGAPSLTASINGETPRVQWESDDENVAGYRIEVDDEEVDKVGKNARSYSLEAVSECKEVSIRVYAYNVWGEVASNEATLVLSPESMSVIQNFKASDGAFENRVVLRWEEVKKAIGYRVFRDDEQIASITDAGTTTYTDQSINPGRLYTYRLEAYDDCDVTPPISTSDVGFTLPNGRITGNIATPNGQIVPNAEVRTSPTLGGSYRFSNNNTSIEVGALEVDITRDFALETWVSPDSEDPFVAFDFFDQNRGGLISVSLQRNGEDKAAVQLIMRDGNGGSPVNIVRGSPLDFIEKRWYHVALIKKDASLYLALNGKVLGERIPTTAFSDYKQQVFRGFSPGGIVGGTGNKGRIDEVRFWKQVNRLPFLGRDYRRTLSGDEEGLYLYYRFDEGDLIQRLGVAYNLAKSTIEEGLNANIQNGALESANCDSVYTSSFSNERGNYLIRNVNYGGVDGQTFEVTPVLANHEFSPESRNITLNPTRAVVDQVDFEDVSTMPVSGTVSYRKLEEKYYQDNPAVCYVPVAEILVDGKRTVPPTVTDLDGRYTTDVTLGKHEISVRPIERTVTDSVGGVKQTLLLKDQATASLASNALYEQGMMGQIYFKVNDTSVTSGAYPAFVFEKSDKSAALSINVEIDASNNQSLVANGAVLAEALRKNKWHLLSMQWSSQGQLTSYVHWYDDAKEQWELERSSGLSVSGMEQARNVMLKNTLGSKGTIQIAAMRKWSKHLSEEVSAALANKPASEDNRIVNYWDLQDGSGTLLLDGRREINGSIEGSAQWKEDPSMPLSLPKEAVERKFVQRFAAPEPVAPRYQGTVLADTAYSLIVTSPTTEVDFENVTGFSLTVNISGRCNFPLGTSVVKLRSRTGCFEYRAENVEQTTVFENLPPLDYTIEVIPTQMPNITFEAREVTLNADKQADFIYRAPLQVDIMPIVGEEFIGEAVEGCGASRDYAVMKQNGYQSKAHQYPVRIQVYEDYLGKRCFVESAQITVVDGIADEAEGIELTFNEAEPDKTVYTIQPGTPNFADGGERPYQKPLTIQVEDENNRSATKQLWAFVEGQSTLTNTFTTGIVDLPIYVLKDPPGDQSYSYIEEGEEICASASYNSQFKVNTELNTGFNAGPRISFTVPFVGITTTTDTEATAKVVAESSTGGGTSEETEFCMSIGQRVQTNEDPEVIGKDGDVFFGVGVNYIFGEVQTLNFECGETSPERMVAAEIDSVETAYAYPRHHIEEQVIPQLETLLDARISEMENTQDTDSLQRLANETGKLRVQITNWQKRLVDSKYQNESKGQDINQYKIKNAATEEQIDDLLDDGGALDGDDDDAEEIGNAVDQINELIDRMNGQYDLSPKFSYLKKNISFAHGAPYEYSYSYEGSNTHTGIFALEIEAGIANEFEVTVNNVGVESEKKLTLGFEYEYTWGDSYGTSVTTGFFLHDDDPDDFFTVDVQKDENTGIFHFVTKGGQSMYPHEEGTRQRQKPVIEPALIMVNQDPNDVARGRLQIANQSETGDPSEWFVHISSHSNPNGLKVYMNGADITGKPVQIHGLEAGQQMDLLIEAERNPLYYEYDSVMLAVYTTDDVPEMDRVSDTSYISVHFSEPCVETFDWMRIGDTQILPSTDMAAFRWLINQSSETTVTENGQEVKKARLPLIFKTANWEAVRDNPEGVESFVLEYSPQGEERWLKVGSTEQRRASLQANEAGFVNMIWDASQLADGDYRFRIKAECKNGSASYSPQVLGTISRIPALPLETYPRDGIAGKSDLIGLLYNKDILCDIKPYNWSIWGVYNGVRYTPYSLRLNGLNTSATLASVDNDAMNKLLEGSQSFSIEMWLKAGVDKEGVILSNMSKEGGQSKGFRLLQRPDGKLVLEVSNAEGTLSQLITNTAINDGKWHHIALQVRRNGRNNDTKGVNLLMDLKNIGQLNFRVDQASLSSGAPLLLGAQGFGNGLHYDGWVDEVRIWDVMRNVAGQNSLTSEWKRHINSAIGLVGYWKLDRPENGEANQTIDLIQQDNEGAIAGGFQWDAEQVPDWDYDGLTYSAAVPATVSCDERNLFFQLPQDINTKKALENVLLKAYVTGVRDQFGNRTDSVGWEFLVDQNSLRWEAPNIDVDKVEGESKTFAMRLRNATGNQKEAFSLTSLPNWVTAEPMEGELLPGGFVDITFTLADWMVSDRYRAEVFAETDEGWEPLLINARVLCENPAYSFSPSNYEQRMALVAEFEFDGTKSTDKHDLAIAFIDGKARGFAQLEKADNGNYVAYLDVHGNDTDAGKVIALHLWDASHCREYAGVELDAPYTFAAGGLVGGTTPELWKPSGNRIQTIEAQTGWNWISWQVADLKEGTPVNQIQGEFSNGDVLKDREAFTTYQSNGQSWSGTLTQLNPKSGYLLNAQPAAGHFRLKGKQVPASTPIALGEGWSLIGYLPEATSRINDALNSIKLDLSANDLIIGPDGFAYFDDEAGNWVGSLKYLLPGTAYRIRVSSNTTLTYPDVQRQSNARSSHRGVSIAELIAEERQHARLAELVAMAGWNFYPRRFERSLSTVVSIPEGIQGEELLLGAFQGENCRGAAVIATVEGKRRFFLPVGLNNPQEALQFKLFNPETGEQYWAANVEAFEANTLVGTVEAPYQLRFLEGGDREPFLKGFQGQQLPEGQPFQEVSLTDHLTNFDQDQIEYVIEGSTDLLFSVQNGVLSAKAPQAHWNGAETVSITAHDRTENALASNTIEASYELLPVDDPPSWKELEVLQGTEDDFFLKIDLNSYVEEFDGDQVRFNITRPEGWTASLEGSVLTATPSENWNGMARFELTAVDVNTQASLSSSTSLNIAVRAVDDAPILHPMGNQRIEVGEGFEPITLSQFLEELDGDQIRWEFELDGVAKKHISVSVEGGVAYLEPIDPNWIGEAVVAVKAVDRTEHGKSASQTIRLSIITEIIGWQADELSLMQNAPNPFQTKTSLLYTLPGDVYTTLSVYSITGKEVKTLVDRSQKAGAYLVEWNGKGKGGNNLPSGVYLGVLRTNDEVMQIKIIKN